MISINASKKRAILATSLLLLLAISTASLLLAGTASAQQSSDWPMFGYDPSHSGFSPSSAPSEFKIGWSFETSGPILATAAVVGGKVYIGSEDMNLYCLDANTGSRLWQYKTGGGITSSAAVVGGKVYFGSFDNNVYCLDANTGTFVWKYTTEKFVHSSPTVINGKVYINSNDKNTYCLDANTGTKIWNFTQKGLSNSAYNVTADTTYAWYSSSPAVVGDRVYVGSFDNNVYCLNANTGAKIWESALPGSIYDSSPVVADGRVFIGCDDFNYYALDANTGAKLWNTTNYVNQFLGSSAFWIESTPAYAYGKVYMPMYHKVVAFDPSNGSLIWQSTMGTMQQASVSIADNKVFTANHDRYIYMFNAQDGKRIQSLQTANGLDSTPVVANGKVYEGGLDGKVYCLVQGTAQSKAAMNVNVNIQPKTIALGEDANIQGYVMSYNGQWPVGTTVTIAYTKPDGSSKTSTATTGDLGDFTDVFVPDQKGTWKVVATWAGSETVAEAKSNLQTFYVTDAKPTPVPTTTATPAPTAIQTATPTAPPTASPSPTAAPSFGVPTEAIYAIAIIVVVAIVAAVALLLRKRSK